MAGPINFKVYLSKENATLAKPEVRRFGIDSEVVSNFQYLRDKLQTIFPNIRGKRFAVSWKDCDADNIVISSDEELQIALLETQGASVRKFYLTLYSDYEQQGTQASASDEGVRHVGVICDGCEKNVYGFRYKCIQCPDYDLCMECEAQSMHPQHCMLRIPIPMQWKNHYTRRLARHMHRICKNQHGHNANENSKDCPFKSTKCEPRSRQGQSYNLSWMDVLASYVQDFANAGNPTKETEQSQQSQEKNTESTKQPESGPHSRKNSESHIEFLKNIGEHIAQFLDPLGIDVNVQVKNDKAQNTSEGTSTGNSPTTSGADSSTKPTTDNETEKKQNETDKSTVTDDNTKVDDEAASSSSSVLNASTETVATEKAAPEPEGWTLLNENDSPPSTSNPSPSNSRASSVLEAPIGKPQLPSAPGTNTLEVTPQKPIYPPLPPIAKIPYHSNPKIQRAIETMIEMGFSNEGGWLTQLLVTKDGDISKALDILAPIRR